MNRRGFLAGIGGIIAAPAIVRVASIMPVRALRLIDIGEGRWLRFKATFQNTGTVTINYCGFGALPITRDHIFAVEPSHLIPGTIADVRIALDNPRHSP